MVTRLAPPTEMLLSPQGQATPMKLIENTEGDGDTKTGNTCNALSGKPGQQPSHPFYQALALIVFHNPSFFSFEQVPSQGFPTSSVSGERVGVVVNTRRSPAAAWPPRHFSAFLFTA